MPDNYYDNKEEVDFRLTGTVIYHDNIPCYVYEVRDGFDDGIFRLVTTYLPLNRENAKREQKKIDSKRFDSFRPVKLGWFNYFEDGRKQARYCWRDAVRRSKQGLSKEAFRTDAYQGGVVSWSNCLNSIGFAEMMRGEYVSFEEAVDKIVDNSSIAIGNEYCVRRDEGFTFLKHKQKNVGIIEKGLIFLNENNIFLKEQLETVKDFSGRIRAF